MLKVAICVILSQNPLRDAIQNEKHTEVSMQITAGWPVILRKTIQVVYLGNTTSGTCRHRLMGLQLI